tara:strand:- start:51 stop:320 length:270 start_codon:yes stop_codon:yes gene_type:complete
MTYGTARHYLHPADPDYIDPPILCPNPLCDDGEVELLALGCVMTCPVCEGEIRIGVDDSPEAMRWADKRGIKVVIDEDAIYGPPAGDEL